MIVTFQLEEYDGSKWTAKGVDVKEKTFTVDGTVHIDGTNTPINDNNSSSVLTTSKDEIKYDVNGETTQTGDNNFILLYIGFLVVSGMTGCRVYKKRKELK